MTSATSNPAPVILQLKDFGGAPDNQQDNSLALKTACQKAATLSPQPVEIHLERGRYRFSASKVGESHGHVILEGLDNVSLIGCGPETELIMTDANASGIVVFRSKNIQIAKLCVDYDPLPFSQGTITAIDTTASTFDYTLESGCPSPWAPHLRGEGQRRNRAYLFDPDTGVISDLVYDQYPAWEREGIEKQPEQLSETSFRYFSRNPVDKSFMDQRVVIVGRSKQDAVKFEEASNCEANHLELYSAPATGFKIRYCREDIQIDQCRILPRPGTSRVFSTNADGLHAKFNRCGIQLTRSTFEAMGDDAVNIGGAYQPVFEQVDPHTLIIRAHDTYETGDQVSLSDPESGSVLAKATVKSTAPTTWEGRSALQVRFNETMQSTLTIKQGAEEKKANQLTSLNSIGSHSEIRDNRFSRHRGRAVMLHCNHSIIEGNYLGDIRGPGIVMGPDFSWGESASGSHVRIRNNTFHNICRSNIIAEGGKKPQAHLPAATTDLRIENNTFSLVGRPNPIPGRGEVGNGISLQHIDRIQIFNNTFSKRHPQCPATTLIVLKDARNITLKNNTFPDDLTVSPIETSEIPTHLQK